MRIKILKEKRDESIRQITDAAMEVFAGSGYEGARVDEIARRAGVNKAMIYYRIGDKKTLYEKVIHDVFGDTAERIKENIKEDLSPEDKLKTYIANIAETMAQHPPLPRIMMREAASGWTHFSQMVTRDISGILNIISEIIDEGVKEGVFLDIDPIVVHLMVVGTMLLFNMSVPVRENFYRLLKEKTKLPLSGFPDDIVPEIQKMMLRALKV